MDVEGCPLPEDRLYDWENFVWVAAEPSGGTWRVGLVKPFTAFIGPVTAITFRPPGSLERGRSLGMVESTRFTGAVRVPFAAEVIEQNVGLASNPRTLNDAPYGAGWVARIRPRRPEEDRPWIEPAAAIASRVTEWVRAHQVRCWPVTPDQEMFEIGIECSAILTQVNEEFARRPPGYAIRLVTDDPTSPIELTRWSLQTGHSLLAKREEGGLFEFLLRKEANPVPQVRRRG